MGRLKENVSDPLGRFEGPSAHLDSTIPRFPLMRSFPGLVLLLFLLSAISSVLCSPKPSHVVEPRDAFYGDQTLYLYLLPKLSPDQSTNRSSPHFSQDWPGISRQLEYFDDDVDGGCTIFHDKLLVCSSRYVARPHHCLAHCDLLVTTWLPS